MRTPPWKSAAPAATGASANQSQNGMRDRGDQASGNAPQVTSIGRAAHAESRGFFNGSSASLGASQGVGDRSSAPGRDKGAFEAPAPCAVDFGLLHELGVLAAITAYSSVLARFKALGVGLGIFSWPAIASLAWFVVTWDAADPPPVRLDHADAMRDPLGGHGPNLGDELEDRVAVLRACPRGDEWARRDLDRHLAGLARLWLPAVLRHLAEMHEHGDATRAERLVIALAHFISASGGAA